MFVIPGLTMSLIESAASGDIEKLQELIHEGSDVNQQDEEGRTALIDASRADHLQCVELLTDAGADVNMTGLNGWTALFTASIRGHTSVVRHLVQKCSADVNMLDSKGSALMYAAAKNRVESVRILLQHGADVNIQD